MVKGYQRRLIELFGIDLPMRVVLKPTEVETLVVPGQGFGLGMVARGTPEFRDFVHRRLAPQISADGPEKLYVSRSALVGTEGGVLLERAVEDNLAADGYEIYHPEQHPLEVQVARYRAARLLVGLDGSAFHLYGFVARPHQRAALIMRRNTLIYRNIERQLIGFTGRVPTVINAIAADWLPETVSRAGRASFGELDLARVARVWPRPASSPIPRAGPCRPPRMLAAAVTAAEAGSGLRLLRRAVDAAVLPVEDEGDAAEGGRDDRIPARSSPRARDRSKRPAGAPHRGGAATPRPADGGHHPTSPA